VVPVTFDQGSYAVVNGRIQFAGIPLQHGSLDIAVFGQNLFDRWYRGHGFDLASLGWKGSVYGPPRTFGLALTYNFKAS
jgi:iron complex outermembrane receptor protein